MEFSLPKSVEIDGEKHDIRYDFRVVLEIIMMLQDTDLTDEDKTEALIDMFYIDPDKIRDMKGAVEKCFWFIDCGSDRKQKKSARLLDWEQDFEYIIAPVNRVLGYEARAVEYDPDRNVGGVHWWTFISAYMEIGSDCLFSQIVSMRDKQARGEKLDKYERKWMRRNSDIVQLKQRYSTAENDIIDAWTKGVNNNG